MVDSNNFSNEFLIKLQQGIVTCFSFEELQTLCFNLGTDHEDIPGTTKSGKARALVSYFSNRGQISKLLEQCFRERPNYNWEHNIKTAQILNASTTAGKIENSVILFMSANPKDTLELKISAEVRSISQALNQTEFREKFILVQEWAVRVTDLQRHFLQHKPSIVHFSGHGSSSSQIILEDHHENSYPVSTRSLSGLFSEFRDDIRCVVLNACYTQEQAQAIAKDIDYVVGMSKAISDTAAISFAVAFYQALGYGKSVQAAFRLGMNQIDLEDLDEQDIPTLICKQG